MRAAAGRRADAACHAAARHAAALQRCTPSLRGIRRGQLRMSTTKKSVTIKRGKARCSDGNPLVYGGAVVIDRPINRGDAVEVVDAGNNIGWGFYNPDSMYRVHSRSMSGDPMLAAIMGRDRMFGQRAQPPFCNHVRLPPHQFGGAAFDRRSRAARTSCVVSAAWAEAP